MACRAMEAEQFLSHRLVVHDKWMFQRFYKKGPFFVETLKFFFSVWPDKTTDLKWGLHIGYFSA